MKSPHSSFPVGIWCWCLLRSGPILVFLLTAPDAGYCLCHSSAVNVLCHCTFLSPRIWILPILSEFFTSPLVHLLPALLMLVLLDSWTNTGKPCGASTLHLTSLSTSTVLTRWSHIVPGAELSASWRGFQLTCAMPPGIGALALIS